MTELNLLMIVDIIVTVLISYKVFTLIKETRAIQLLKGILVLFLINYISRQLGFLVLNMVLEQLRTVALIALPVVFQPELRRALEQIGRGKLFKYWTSRNTFKVELDKLVAAVIRLSKSQIGGLIVLKRETGLREIIDTGVKLDAILSTELLVNIFIPKSPLHDGAVIVDQGRIVAANCLLPLTENKKISQSLGTRHRAAVGISEETDALVIIVSEETGVISTAFAGKLKYNLDEFDLKEELFVKFREDKDD
ncbi:diadenylate cyclase CdaA [Natroniella sulfidigena]|uniref:diadenylate cyclase CdaA n=1 Tax=Natroniella sulfidigena TaxID=723921 RepID=UPI00200A4DF0|nr:diadenylate cyclase CdaA [Natroniella sulfidigena]MCK8816150.1 diadenylate cyclase CdaA [Natroniella sulfidigena]